MSKRSVLPPRESLGIHEILNSFFLGWLCDVSVIGLDLWACFVCSPRHTLYGVEGAGRIHRYEEQRGTSIERSVAFGFLPISFLCR